MSSEFRRVLKHTFIYGFGSIISKMIGFIMIPIYTRFLDPDAYGLIELLEMTINVLQLIVTLSLPITMLRFFSEDRSREAWDKIISTTILCTGFLAVVTAGLCILYSPHLSLLILGNRGHAHPFTVMMFIMIFNCLIELPLVVLRAKEQSIRFISVCMARFLLACFLNIFFIVILRQGIAGWLLSSLWTSVIICSYLLITTLAGVRKIRFSFSLLKRMTAYTLPLIPAGLAMFWIHNGDRYILNAVKGLTDVGIYGLGYKFAIMISFLIGQPFFLIWSVRMFDVLEQKGGDKVFARTFTYFASVVIMAWLFLSVVVEDVISIMADDVYHTAVFVRNNQGCDSSLVRSEISRGIPIWALDRHGVCAA